MAGTGVGAPPKGSLLRVRPADATGAREGDIYVEPVAGGPVTRLTSDASPTLVNGTTDWVNEEELGLRDAFRWSPDGRRIAYLQFDMSGVRDFLLVNYTDPLYPTVIPIQYPKAGQVNSAIRAGVVDASGGPTTWLKLEGDPRQNYVPRFEWAGVDELMVQRMNRHQDRDAVLLVHGTGDDNVRYQGTERLVNRLVELGRPFDFIAYPNRSHCICEGEGTTLHVYSLLTRYLTTNLPAGGR